VLAPWQPLFSEQARIAVRTLHSVHVANRSFRHSTCRDMILMFVHGTCSKLALT